jgi:hypothetical protein
MDDSRIRQLSEEVLGQLRKGGTTEGRSLESRVAALETAVARLAGGHPALAVMAPAPGPCHDAHPPSSGHPSTQLLKVVGSVNGMCVLEPDKPCNNSGACRTFGF